MHREVGRAKDLSAPRYVTSHLNNNRWSNISDWVLPGTADGSLSAVSKYCHQCVTSHPNDCQTKQHLRPTAARHCRRSTVWSVSVLLTVPTGLLHQHHTNSYSKIQHKNAVCSWICMNLGCYGLFVLVLSPVRWQLLVSVVSHQSQCSCTCQQSPITVITFTYNHVSQSIFTHVT
jgi:hypothetical protein